MSCNFSHVSADSKGLHLFSTTWNFRVFFLPLCCTCNLHSPSGFNVEPPNSFSLTDELSMGGSPNCVMIERSSKQSTLQVAPVSSWQAKVVVKSSAADLKKLTSANHCFALVCTRETVSTCRQLSSELSSSSSNCCTFLDERHTDAKWPFLWHLLHVCFNAGHSVLLVWQCLRPQYLHVGSAELSEFLFSFFFSFFKDLDPSLFFQQFVSPIFLSLVASIVFIWCEAVSLDVHISMAFWRVRDFSLRSLTLSPWLFNPMTNLSHINSSV